MITKCAVCKDRPIVWSWQPTGPGGEMGSFSLPGKHVKGPLLVKVCEECQQVIARGDQIVVYTLKDNLHAWGTTAVVCAFLRSFDIEHATQPFSKHLVRLICERCGVRFNHDLVMYWANRHQAWQRYHIAAEADAPGSGVSPLDLTYDITEQLGLGQPGRVWLEVKDQWRANIEAILTYLAQKEMASESRASTDSH